MGLQENGTVGFKKYRKMDSDKIEDDEGGFVSYQENVNQNSSSRRYVMACAIFASLNSVLLGYDVGVMSGAIIFIQEDLKITEVQEEILVGILSIISLLGSLAGGKTSDAIGRKWTMAFAAIVFQTGLFAGIGIGFGIMIAPVYIAEISPTVARGSLTSFPEIFVNFGILLGYVSNYAFSGLPAHINWRIMLAVGILPSVFIGFALLVIPESPRWLVMQNRIDEARIGEIEERLAEIQQAASFVNAGKYEERAVWRDLLYPSPGVRRMLITGCGIQIFQQITGIDATVYYSPTIFKDMLVSRIRLSFWQQLLLLDLRKQFLFCLRYFLLTKQAENHYFM
ncbi:putative polyol transporter 4 [Forsythia ovata]|uniref:Polyol transporter 4 n=1 Tax=Forsythia ovata TaxID=205694 RepID=A0ABD1S2X6_9LAMI